MNWYIVTITNNAGDTALTIPIQAPMSNSIEGRFDMFLKKNPEYKRILPEEGYKCNWEIARDLNG